MTNQTRPLLPEPAHPGLGLYSGSQIRAYALAAYQAGRDAGIADALAAVRQRYKGDNNREDAEVLRCAMAIRAGLKGGHRG